MGSEYARPEIDDPAGRVQQPWVGVELARHDDNRLIVAGKPLDPGNRGCGGQLALPGGSGWLCI